ncbi:hypothetical protein GH741_08510 [Aquibacillus halophilus]|uniref:Uncharacterized protein n=1 Tax=Aquibacillus halophilus TaxID=930132 RepID=A0A6A8DAT9_9BACI|nr:hypothetical protein [Aquibacillus halophilus]MRH42728.1 hypothetical protein [Aquibacillus halophilus]
MKSQIIVDKVTVINRELIVHYHCKGEIANYINGNRFVAKYDSDIKNVPESLLIIPFLANVTPIAWVTNSIIYCGQVDLQFYKSLNVLKDYFKSMYPSFLCESDLTPNLIINNDTHLKENSKSALFFNNGIASVASSIQRRDDEPLLISVWGAETEVTNQEAWQAVSEELRNFATSFDTKVSVIKSNFRDMINYEELNGSFEELIGGHWWTKIQHDLGIIGLSAPLAYHHQITKLYIGATHQPSFISPFGSDIEIESNISWGSDLLQVFPQGYVLTRHEKIALISNYIKTYDSTLKIKACQNTQISHNCSNCEKCIRTMISMLLEGLDPSKHGFKHVDATTLDRMRHHLENDGVVTPENLFHYKEIQSHIPSKKEGLTVFTLDFFNWFEQTNFKRVTNKLRRKEIIIYYKNKTKSKVGTIVNTSKGQDILRKLKNKKNNKEL